MPTRSPDPRAWWLPFTANAAFVAAPRLLVAAKGVHYRTDDGREILDGISGLWCVNAGHGRREIADAISRQVLELDYASPFQMAHPLAFEFAERLCRFAPRGLEHVFFSTSGSESVETALKIARAYHRARGEPERSVVIGRDRGYHGVGFGGTSVGGFPANRELFAPLVGDVDHMPASYDPESQRFSRGQPESGADRADELLPLIERHGAERIAAVIVEPVAGAGGVLVPPRGYLERLRSITSEHGILLIFDEVITGFGRLGAPFAAQRFGIVPDVLTTAKALTNGVVPMGGTLVSAEIYDAVISAGRPGIELPHGYTYSGHPVACAAGLATLRIHEDEQLSKRADRLALDFEEGLHRLASRPAVVDVRNLGLMGAVELEPLPDRPGERAAAAFRACFERGLLVRYTGETLALCPPLVCEEPHLEQLFALLEEGLAVAAELK